MSMTYAFSVSFFLVVLFSCGASNEIPPLYFCDGPTYLSNEIQPYCKELCKNDWDLTSQVNIEVYNKVHHIPVKMGICVAKKEKWVYGESCLWARSSHLEASYDIVPDVDICKRLWAEKCPSGVCHLQSKKPDPIYSYCSEVTIEHDQYYITEFNSATLGYDASTKLVFFENHKAPLIDGFYKDPSNLKIFMWDITSTPDDICPVSDSRIFKSYKKAKDQSSELKYWIPDIGMILSGPYEIFDDVHCRPSVTQPRNLFVSKSGIIFAETNSNPDKSSHIIQLASGYQDNEKMIVNSVNNLEMMRDKQTCTSRCLMSRNEGVHLLGNGALVTREHNTTICEKAFSCVLKSRPIICRDPLMLKLQCMTHQAWWDPREAYLFPQTTCRKLLSKLPSSPMKSGAITVNKSGVFFHHPNAVLLLHPDTFSRNHIGNYIFKSEEIKLRDDIDLQSEVTAEIINSRNITEAHSGWSFSYVTALMDAASSVTSWFHSITD